MRTYLIGLPILAIVALTASQARADGTACLAGGRRLDSAGKHAEAIAAWKACLVKTPSDATIEGEIAAAAYQLHDLPVAEQFARAASDHASEMDVRAAAKFTLGRIREDKQDKKGAIAAYEESLALRENAAVRARLVAIAPAEALPPGYATVVPPAFAKVVEDRRAELGIPVRVIAWWQDDLDRDGKPESIATLCVDDDTRLYLIQRGGTLLSARGTMGGRNPCPTGKPSWHIERTGSIDHSYSVHRATETENYAIRGGHVVKVREGEDGADGVSDTDWDALVKRDDGRATPIIAVSSTTPRTTTIGGGTFSASVDLKGAVVLHVKSAAAIHVALCDEQTCAAGRPVKGFANLPIDLGPTAGAQKTIEIVEGGKTVRAFVIWPDGEIGGYPSAEPEP